MDEQTDRPEFDVSTKFEMMRKSDQNTDWNHKNVQIFFSHSVTHAHNKGNFFKDMNHKLLNLCHGLI